MSLANDLAMLKVDPSLLADISPVEFGDSSSVRPGQMAVAIWKPLRPSSFNLGWNYSGD